MPWTQRGPSAAAAALISAFLLVAASIPAAGLSGAADAEPPVRTHVEIRDGFFRINGEPTYSGSPAEGLLMNVRMVHAIFDDANPATRPDGFDADANTAAFLAKIPDYVAHGALAFTVNLQGGDPGYAGALNSAFAPDGSLREEHMARTARVIEACDRHGAAVLLGCFSPEQDQAIEDADGIRAGVAAVAEWVRRKGYENVLLEIVDDHTDEGFDHASLRGPEGIEALIGRAHEVHPALLVSASGGPNGRLDHQIGNAADFILLHFGAVPPERIFQRVSAASKHVKAIVANRDSRTGASGVKALDAAVSALCSWGFAHREQNERYPFRYAGAEDDPAVYARLRELTTPPPAESGGGEG